MYRVPTSHGSGSQKHLKFTFMLLMTHRFTLVYGRISYFDMY